MCYKNNITTHRTFAASAAAFAALAAYLLGAMPTLAQARAGSFSGTLLDTIGRALPNQSLMLTDGSTGARRQADSDGSGRFAFPALNPGEYDLEVQAPGFGGTYHIRLAAGQHLQRDVALQIGAVQETITVTRAPRRAASAPQSLPDMLEPSRCAQGPIGGCVEPPLKIVDVRPTYPASRDDAGATVLLAGRIGVDGYIGGVRLQASPDDAFARAAIDAVKQWQFTPTRIDSVPVETPITVSVTFTSR